MAKTKMIGLQKYYVIPDDYGYEIDIKTTPAIEYFAATADRRLALLKRCEWIPDANGRKKFDWCPICELLRAQGHASDCELEKELADDT